MKKLFEVNVNKYSKIYNYYVYYPATLENPKDNAVSFITKDHLKFYQSFQKCKKCLIFWPMGEIIPDEIKNRDHVFVKCNNPHLRYCQFYEENHINNNPLKTKVRNIDGALIGLNARIGNDVIIFPNVYIDDDVVIGSNCYIAAGVKLMGKITIGNNVTIRENTVIGADGLSTDRNECGKPVRMPQFGGVVIGDNVYIGANAVIARGAIDDTIIQDDVSIDNSVFISHNVRIGKRSYIVGESLMFGSSSLGEDSFVSGNCTIRNGISIGNNAFIGMGAVVIRDVDDGMTVKGNPAK